MAAAAQCVITLEETELLSFLRQNIQCKLAEEAESGASHREILLFGAAAPQHF